MNQAYTGGCACGAIRYEIAAEPIFENHCQCRDCQRKSGTGHGSYLTFPRGGVKHSGYGRESGAQQLDEYLNVKGLWIQHD